MQLSQTDLPTVTTRPTLLFHRYFTDISPIIQEKYRYLSSRFELVGFSWLVAGVAGLYFAPTFTATHATF